MVMKIGFKNNGSNSIFWN